VVTESSRQWLFLQYHQLVDELGCQHFTCEAQLILPTVKFFPANASNPQQLAEITLQQVKSQAGMTQWPIQIKRDSFPSSTEKLLPKLTFEHGFHGMNALVNSELTSHNTIDIELDVTQFPKAETLVATLSQQLSSILLTYSGIESNNQEYVAMTEVMATFLGFGVMLANTSYQFKGGCGSCYQSRANRQTGLSEEEMVYSLAMFCQLKGIRNNEVLPHLKSYLRGVYKQSVRDLINHPTEFKLLQARLSC
jgi:hypothetical protein